MRFVPEKEEKQPEGFDLTVHHRDPLTGLIVKTDPYIMRTVAVGEAGDKMRVWERPAGSGNLWDKSGKPIGRWDKNAKEGKRFLKDEPHVLWTPPETEDQKIARTVEEQRHRISELEKELNSIKLEKDPKPQAQSQKKTPGA